MTSSTASYPPPLSAAPTVGTLRELLDALASGTYEVPPVPPLPTAPAAPVRPQVRWRVEHVASGVPVQLSIGDDLGPDELRHLRDLLGARWWGDDRAAGSDAVVTAPGPDAVASATVQPTAAAPPVAAPSAAAPVEPAPPAPAPPTGPPSLSWAAGEPSGAPTSAIAVAGAVGAAVAAAAGAAARFLDAVGLP